VREVLALIVLSGIEIAVFWHVVVALTLAALISGRWRPTRVAGILAAALPLVSVAGAAWKVDNVFNGWIFTILFVASLGIASLLSYEKAERSPPWAFAVGVAGIAFAWVYPHFLEGKSPWLYLVAAPIGLVPCPTLALVAGFGLLARGFGSRGWSLLIGSAAVFYAVVGVVWLRVWLDVLLLVPGVALVALGMGIHKPAEREHLVPTGLPRSVLQGEPTLPA
jgi:hypothetical protein